MILVTGAAGKTGRALVGALAARGQAVRALVRREAQVRLLEARGAAEAVVADMLNYDQVEQALGGARKVYLVCPNMHPKEPRMAAHVIRAAQQQGAHVVYHSVLHPQIEAMPHHWRKLRVEEKLLESGLPFTILQPAAYLQNLLAGWPRLVEEGVYAVPYAAPTRVSMVDLDDVAEVAARVLAEAGHEGAIYELAGPETLTQEEVAATLARQLGRDVRLEIVSREAWAEQARKRGLGDYEIATLVKMFEHYERYHFVGNPNVLEGLLERKATRLADFADRIRQKTARAE